MIVKVEIAGILRRPAGLDLDRLGLPGGSTAASLLETLGYRETERRSLRLSRDGEVLDPGSELADGDTLVLFAAIGGG